VCRIVDLGDARLWPDCMRGSTPNWNRTYSSNHFDNVPFCAPMPPQGYCDKGCATARLEKAEAILKNPNATKRQKAESLAWIVHLIGDVHQPLHVIDDGGGNGVYLTPLLPNTANSAPWNLHSYWDNFQARHDDRPPQGALDSFLKDSEVEARTLALATANQDAWSQGKRSDWMKESHQVAVTFAYTQLGAESACKMTHYDSDHPPSTAPAAPSTYQLQGQAHVRDQLAKASVRLAAELDRILG